MGEVAGHDGADQARLRQGLSEVQTTFSTVISLAAVPLSRHRAFPTVLDALEWLDRAVLSVPSLPRYACCVVVVLREPRRGSHQ